MTTLDPNTEAILAQIHPDIAARWREVQAEMINVHSVTLRVTEGLRDIPTQWTYWKKGRMQQPDGKWVIVNPKQIVTHAYPGQSLHGFGLALDACQVGPDPFPADNQFWENYGDMLKKYGLTWGGDWLGPECDRPHCEDKYGFTLSEIQKVYLKNNDIKDVWDICDTRLMK